MDWSVPPWPSVGPLVEPALLFLSAQLDTPVVLEPGTLIVAIGHSTEDTPVSRRY